MRAKFRVDSVRIYEYMEEASLSAVSSFSREDNEFAAATPSGALAITITSPAGKGYFVPGRAYYLDFSPAAPATGADGS